MTHGRRAVAPARHLLSGILAAALVAAVACRQVAGIDDRQESPRCGNAVYRDAACGECTELRCCDALAACARHPACASTYACLAACTPSDDACRATCWRDGPLPSPLASVLACQGRECAPSCGASCAGLVTESRECTTCLRARCRSTASACFESERCLLYRTCRAECSSAACKDICEATYHDGTATNVELEACRASECGAECAAWWCKVPPVQLLKNVELTVTLRLRALEQKQPIANLRVRRCDRQDILCVTDSNVSSGELGRTSADGLVQVSMVLNRPFDGWFVIDDPDSKVYVPVAVMTWPPLVTNAALMSWTMRSDTLAALATAAGAQLDPNAGVIVVHSRDCDEQEAPGVAYSTDAAGAQAFYFKDSLPSSTSQQTDESLAIGGFVNVTPNTTLQLVARSRRSPPLTLFETGTMTFAGMITFVDHAPTR